MQLSNVWLFFYMCIYLSHTPPTTCFKVQNWNLKQGFWAYIAHCEMWILYSRSKMCETEKSFQ